jgi:hypothetical protein
MKWDGIEICMCVGVCQYITLRFAFNASVYLVQKEEINVRLYLSIQTKLSYEEKKRERRRRERKTCMNEGRYIGKRK